MAEGGRTNDEPTLLERAIWSVLVEIFTVLPGEVVSFDRKRRLANVQPSIKTKDSEGGVESRPQVVNVPVIFLSGGGFVSSFDLSEGDSVAIIWSQRSIDRWQELAREVDPQDGRMFHASDAFCIPGPQPKTAARAIKQNAAFFGLEDLSAGLTVNEDGSSSLENSGDGFKVGSGGGLDIEKGSTELLSELESGASTGSTAAGVLANNFTSKPFVDPNTGYLSPDAQSEFSDLQSAFDTIKNAAGNLQ